MRAVIGMSEVSPSATSWRNLLSAAKSAGFGEAELPALDGQWLSEAGEAGLVPAVLRPPAELVGVQALSDADPGRRASARAAGGELLRAAGAAPIGVLVVRSASGEPRSAAPPTGERAAPTYVDRLHYLLDSLRALVVPAERAGMTLAIEPGGGGFLTSPSDCIELVDRLGSHAAGICLPVSAVARFGCPIDWAISLRGRLACVRVEENADACPHNVVPFSQLLEGLHAVGFAGPIVLAGRLEWASRLREESLAYGSRTQSPV